MKRILASMAVLGLMASPALAATAKPKPAAAPAKPTKPNTKVAATATPGAKVKTNHKKAK